MYCSLVWWVTILYFLKGNFVKSYRENGIPMHQTSICKLSSCNAMCSNLWWIDYSQVSGGNIINEHFCSCGKIAWPNICRKNNWLRALAICLVNWLLHERDATGIWVLCIKLRVLVNFTSVRHNDMIMLKAFCLSHLNKNNYEFAHSLSFFSHVSCLDNQAYHEHQNDTLNLYCIKWFGIINKPKKIV